MPVLIVTMTTLQISTFDAQVLALIEKSGEEGLFATNDELSEKFRCSTSYIQQSTAKLRNMGLISIKRMCKFRNRFKKTATYTVAKD